jgi:tetratricopeptide (TPR) repeat protein/KaiC/GvpD/RAD55 family RecA-like ATPase
LKSEILVKPVLVGRETELKNLMDFFNLVFNGKGTTVFVSGEAGSGKTRLVDEFLKISQKKDIAVLTGRCFSDVIAPYFPFMEAFDHYFKENKKTETEEFEIINWLAGPKQMVDKRKIQNLTPQAWKDLTIAAVTKALVSISQRKPVVLFIDDLQWADTASLSLLHYIASSITSARVLLLATYRKEELSNDSEGRPHPLEQTLQLMRRSDLFKEILLENLESVNISLLAENIVGGKIHSELAEKLAQDSRGNPLFIVESLRMLFEQGSLIKDEEQWRVSIDELGIPAKIKDIILRRLTVLLPSQRRILSLASVIGDKFDVDLLGAVLGEDSLGVLETLNSVAQSSSLIRCEGDHFKFDHSKIRDAIYEEISPPLMKGYHARIAEKLESMQTKSNEGFSVSALAYHYSQAGNIGKTIKYSLAAGENAIERFSNSEAIKHFQYVLKIVADNQTYSKEKNLALERLGDALSAFDSHDEAAQVFLQLAKIETGKVKLRAYRKAMEASYNRRNDKYTLELVKQAEEFAASDNLEYARILYQKARAQGLLGDVKSGCQQMENLVQVFVDENSLSDAAYALFGLGKFSRDLKDYRKSISSLQRSNVLLEELENKYSQMELNTLRGPLFLEFGLFEQALKVYEENVRIAEETGHYRKIGTAYSVLSTCLEFTGQVKEAIIKMHKAAEYMEKTDSPRLGQYLFPHLLRQYSRLGDIQNAYQYFDKVSNFSVKTKMSPEGNPIALWAMAVYFSETNQLEKAAELFKKIFQDHLNPLGTYLIAFFYADFIKADYAAVLTKQGKIEEAHKINQSIKKHLDLEHVDITAELMVPSHIRIGKEFEFRLVLVNVSKKNGVIVKIDSLLPDEFEVISHSSSENLHSQGLEAQKINIKPFQVLTLKFNLKARKIGTFNLNTSVIYLDDLGQTKTSQPKATALIVQQPLACTAAMISQGFPGKVSTGLLELDSLLIGGIPANYAVVLNSYSINEQTMLIKSFLEASVSSGETTFYLTKNLSPIKNLVEEYPSCFYLFLCNPQAEAFAPNLPNIFKLKGLENLTEIDISITKAFRSQNDSKTSQKRICIDLVSDVLLQHHALITRKWLSTLISTLKTKSFTVLVVFNPLMHQSEEVHAILSLFDGEIEISEKETSEGTKRVLKIRRMNNQKYSEKEVILDKESLSL